ncbi:MAG: response regulator transcription factor [Pseudomonadota bacterium]
MADLCSGAALTLPRILVVRHLKRAPSSFDCGMLTSASCEDRVYRIDSVAAAGFDEIEHRCRAHMSRILVLDIGLIPDAAALQNLRRRLSAATDLLIGWDSPPVTLDMALVAQTCGCIEWTLSPAQLAHALDAVIAGELWFPRAVLQSLYLSLRHPEAPAAPLACAADHITDGLTTRETEVLALMRHGMTNKEIAERLEISVNTVKKHVAHAFQKRGLHTRRQVLD